MNGTVHKIVAVATALCVAAVYFPTITMNGIAIYPIVGVPFSLAGGVLADVDINGSEYGHKYPFIAKVTTHRGITHTSAVLALVIAPTWLLVHTQNAIATQLLASSCFGFAVGYFSHLICADWWNGKGIPLLWPITSKRFHICRVVTASRKIIDGKEIKSHPFQEYIYAICWVLLMIFHVVCHYGGLVI